MSYIVNYGEIKANKVFDEKATQVICNILGTLKGIGSGVDVYDDIIYFEEHYNGYLEDDLRNIIEQLKNDGYVFNGDVTYYGDYEGTIYVEDNVVDMFDAENRWQRDATDEDLIMVLESRGYEVKKIRKESGGMEEE